MSVQSDRSRDRGLFLRVAALLALAVIAARTPPAAARVPAAPGPAAARASAAPGVAAPGAAAAAISLADYRARLLEVQADLGRGDWGAARAQARELEGRRIAFGGDELVPDLSVLGPLAAARGRAAAVKVALPLAQLIRALPTGAPAAAPGGTDAPKATATTAATALTGARAAAAGGADRALLERLRRSQALAEIPAGGSLPDPGLDSGGLLDALRDFLRPAARAFARLWDGLRDLLERWVRSVLAGGRGRRAPFGLRSVVLLALFLAVAMAALAFQAARRRQRGGGSPAAAAPNPAPARDDDPLSRAAGEWETYARELAAGGHYREAIRAWYHAVLVTLYKSGILQFRKGRTNWEYISKVPPSTLWRPALVEMTRHFEREWYGRDRSSPEALAASQDLARRLLDAVRSSPL
ncbi:MAG TPA: DUF4129 domain-containing protein [Thermoanaerobaculia bacterium]|nr:DUF4129 domain-containing protein [Thermoanaerobaculia bacterium]